MKFRRTKRLKVRAGLDMTPLINVVLLLLLFFMLSSTFSVHSTIPIQAAAAPGAPAYDEKDLTVTLVYGEGGPDGKGPVYVNDVALASMDELSRVLAEAHAERPDIRVLIRPDARVESGRLIEVLGLVHDAGIDRYRIAAQPRTEASGK